MKQIPQPTKIRYEVLLAQHHITATLKPYYLKWLRYYVDFCQKYRFEESEKKSLPYFISKLKEKKQTDQQQNQAFDAVSIFFELEPIKIVRETNPYYEQKPKLTHSSWMTIYNDLKSEIKFIPFQTCH